MQIVYEKLPAPRKQMLLIPALGGRGGRISINPRPTWSKYKEIISQIFFLLFILLVKTQGAPEAQTRENTDCPTMGSQESYPAILLVTALFHPYNLQKSILLKGKFL